MFRHDIPIAPNWMRILEKLTTKIQPESLTFPLMFQLHSEKTMLKKTAYMCHMLEKILFINSEERDTCPIEKINRKPWRDNKHHE